VAGLAPLRPGQFHVSPAITFFSTLDGQLEEHAPADGHLRSRIVSGTHGQVEELFHKLQQHFFLFLALRRAISFRVLLLLTNPLSPQGIYSVQTQARKSDYFCFK
jgi:hypothetical protein